MKDIRWNKITKLGRAAIDELLVESAVAGNETIPKSASFVAMVELNLSEADAGLLISERDLELAARAAWNLVPPHVQQYCHTHAQQAYRCNNDSIANNHRIHFEVAVMAYLEVGPVEAGQIWNWQQEQCG